MANRRGKKPFAGGKGSRPQPAATNKWPQEFSSQSHSAPSMNSYSGNGYNGPQPSGTNRWPQEFSSQSHLAPFMNSYGGNVYSGTFQGFSMRDEARNTMSHTPLSSKSEKLRQKPVTFVSAGFIDPLKDTEVEKTGDEVKPAEVPGVEETPTEAGPAVIADGAEPCEEDEAETIATEEVDVQVVEGFEEMLAAEEEVVMADALPPAEAQENNILPTFFFDLTGDKNLRPVQQPSTEPTPHPTSVDPESDCEIILFKGRSARFQKGHKSGSQKKKPQFLIDKMNNKKATESQMAITNVLESLDDTEKNLPVEEGPAAASKTTKAMSDKLEEVNEEDAILADYIANMEADPEDDFLAQIRSFGQRELGGSDDAFGSNSFGDEDDSGDMEDEDEEAFRRKGEPSVAYEDLSVDADMDADMDDETLARLLAKQDQLGISSDELLLLDGAHPRSRRNKLRSSALNSPSVTEAFEGLDLAAFEPPVPRKGRRRKQPPAFNVSDSELEAALRKAWERDRERKKSRKLEREAKRVQGLLRKDADPEDLRVKYISGITLEDIKHEVYNFLIDTVETIQFPPMDKQGRMLVHEIANKFNIKTQSTGKGDQRRPVLYRTQRTVKYNKSQWNMAEKDVANAALKVTRKIHYFRPGGSGSSRGGRPSGGGGRSSHSAVSYREGEIVGASIPELGQDNKGRAMLEKMGWAKGMGLGTLENKGILEPVAQVVKTSKAGLG